MSSKRNPNTIAYTAFMDIVAELQGRTDQERVDCLRALGNYVEGALSAYDVDATGIVVGRFSY